MTLAQDDRAVQACRIRHRACQAVIATRTWMRTAASCGVLKRKFRRITSATPRGTATVSHRGTTRSPFLRTIAGLGPDFATSAARSQTARTGHRHHGPALHFVARQRHLRGQRLVRLRAGVGRNARRTGDEMSHGREMMAISSAKQSGSSWARTFVTIKVAQWLVKAHGAAYRQQPGRPRECPMCIHAAETERRACTDPGQPASDTTAVSRMDLPRLRLFRRSR